MQKLLLVKGKKIYLPGSDILVMEGTFAQDSAEDISMEDMADTHDSYDAVLAGNEGHRVETQVADLEVAAFATTHMSQTKIGNWSLISTLLLFCCIYPIYTLIA
jgi:hypothetical protein